MKLKYIIVSLGLLFVVYILYCFWCYFMTPKNFEETVKWQGSQ